MSAGTHSKQSYRTFSRLKQFYTGGGICVSAQEDSFVCACDDAVHVVSIATGQVVRSFEGDTEPVTAVAASPDGKHVFTASRSLTTKCWDAATGRCVRAWKAHKFPVSDMAVDAGSTSLATASSAQEVRVWDAVGGFCTHTFSGHSGVVLCVIFHPSEQQLATAGDDGKVVLWDLVDRRQVASYDGHVSAVTCLAWAQNNWCLLSGGRDKVVNVWDIRSHVNVQTIAVFDSIEALVVLPPDAGHCEQTDTGGGSNEGFVFIAGGESGLLRTWDGVTGNCLRAQKRAEGQSGAPEIVAMLLLPSSEEVAFARADCRIQRTHWHSRSLRPHQTLLGSTGEITSVCFAGVAAAVPEDGMQAQDAGTDAPAPATLPPNVAIATNSNLVHILETASMGCTGTLTGHSDVVLALAVSCVPGATQRTVIATGSKDHTVRMWDMSAGKCIAVASGHLGPVTSVAFGSRSSPKQTSFLVSGSSDTLLRVWDLDALWAELAGGQIQGKQKDKKKGKLAGEVKGKGSPLALQATAAVAAHEKDVNCVAVSSNGQLVVSGGADRVAKLWCLPALSAPRALRAHRRGIWDARFAPKEQIVLTAGGDATIRLWSVRDCSCLKTLAGHSSSVLRAIFASDGNQVLSCGSDGLLKLWSVSTGECISTGTAHEGKCWGLDVGGDSEEALVTGGSDGSLVLWSDCTLLDKKREQASAEHALIEQQELSNALHQGNFLKAAKLACRIKQPGRLLKVVQEAISTSGGVAGSDSLQVLVTVVRGLSREELSQVLGYACSWNTTTRNCISAVALLHAILTAYSPRDLAALPGASESVEAMMLYTQRHYQRMDRLLQSAYIIPYLLQQMRVYTNGQADQDHRSAPGYRGASTYIPGVWALHGNGKRDTEVWEQGPACIAQNGFPSQGEGGLGLEASAVGATQADDPVQLNDDDRAGEDADPDVDSDNDADDSGALRGGEDAGVEDGNEGDAPDEDWAAAAERADQDYIPEGVNYDREAVVTEALQLVGAAIGMDSYRQARARGAKKKKKGQHRAASPAAAVHGGCEQGRGNLSNAVEGIASTHQDSTEPTDATASQAAGGEPAGNLQIPKRQPGKRKQKKRILHAGPAVHAAGGPGEVVRDMPAQPGTGKRKKSKVS